MHCCTCAGNEKPQNDGRLQYATETEKRTVDERPSPALFHPLKSAGEGCSSTVTEKWLKYGMWNWEIFWMLYKTHNLRDAQITVYYSTSDLTLMSISQDQLSRDISDQTSSNFFASWLLAFCPCNATNFDRFRWNFFWALSIAFGWRSCCKNLEVFFYHWIVWKSTIISGSFKF